MAAQALRAVGSLLCRVVIRMSSWITKLDPPPPVTEVWAFVGAYDEGDRYVVTLLSSSGEIRRPSFDPRTLSFDEWPDGAAGREVIERQLAERVLKRPGTACA